MFEGIFRDSITLDRALFWVLLLNPSGALLTFMIDAQNV